MKLPFDWMFYSTCELEASVPYVSTIYAFIYGAKSESADLYSLQITEFLILVV